MTTEGEILVYSAIALAFGVFAVLVCLALRLVGITLHPYHKDELVRLTLTVSSLNEGLVLMEGKINEMYMNMRQEREQDASLR